MRVRDGVQIQADAAKPLMSAGEEEGSGEKGSKSITPLVRKRRTCWLIRGIIT